MGVYKSTHAMMHINVVFLHEEINPRCRLIDDLSLATDHLREIDRQRAYPYPMCRKLFLRLVIMFRTVEQCLRWNTPYIQASSSQCCVFLY